MKLWMSGEIQNTVSESYRQCMAIIEEKVNNYLKGKEYGKGLKEVAYIAIIRKEDDPDYNEVYKYSKRNKEAEFRLKIDYEKFLNVSFEIQLKLISESLLRAIKMMPEIGVKDLDHNRLMEDVSQVLAGV